MISDTGQNLRINVDTGVATLDGGLNFPGVPPVPATPAAGVTAAAYTNNDADAGTATALFDLDTAADQVVIQLPPNAGALNPTGKLEPAQDVSPDAGFDIWSDLAAALRYASSPRSPRTSSRLYEIDVLTGKAKSRGRFRNGQQVIGLAIELDELD